MIHRTSAFNCPILGMDWIGSAGCMFSVDAVNDLYVVQEFASLIHPTCFEQFASVKDSICSIFAYISR
jgi:hypothetical protein